MVVDALGREIATSPVPQRVVSLVPSETESVAVLAGTSRLVGRTTYCEEPRGAIEHVPAIGGTKDIDVARIVALAPDLVLANQEENTKSGIEALIEVGLRVHVSFPCNAVESMRYLASLAALLGVDGSAHVDAARRVVTSNVSTLVPTFVPIWDEPMMTFDGRTFASDVLELAGGRNVFAGRPRRYPLAADLGRREPLPEARVEGRDTRYPRLAWDELEKSEPSLVLLPDEPFAFGEAHAEKFRALRSRPRVVLVSGKLLFWYGVRMAQSVDELRAIVGS